MVLPEVDQDFWLICALSPLELQPSAEESMVGEQVKMLSYEDYTIGVGLRSMDATGAVTDTADRA